MARQLRLYWGWWRRCELVCFEVTSSHLPECTGGNRNTKQEHLPLERHYALYPMVWDPVTSSTYEITEKVSYRWTTASVQICPAPRDELHASLPHSSWRRGWDFGVMIICKRTTGFRGGFQSGSKNAAATHVYSSAFTKGWLESQLQLITNTQIWNLFWTNSLVKITNKSFEDVSKVKIFRNITVAGHALTKLYSD
jgi:hypothetical protein